MIVLHDLIGYLDRRWLYGFLLFFCFACGHKNSETGPIPQDPGAGSLRAGHIIDSITGSIRTGDLIARTGNDFTSYCLRQFCQTDDTYSHCGIASIENDSVFVYHALGGDFNPHQKILREPLALFAAPLANHGFGVFRFSIDDLQQQKLLLETKTAYRRGIPFDMDFDLETDEQMYCSEFTAKMYRRCYGNDTMFTASRIGSFDFLAPDNLFTHPYCRAVFRGSY